ncbi:MAG: PQQ-binding-like beta-propeller repeat protein, partial [Caldilineaceae bacterium]
MVTKDTFVQAAVEAVINFFIERVIETAQPPPTDTEWLRRRGTQVAMHRALLNALEESLEHTPNLKPRAFDETFLRQDAVTALIAGLLLPTQTGTPDQVAAALIDVWREQLRDGFDTPDDGFEDYVRSYVDNLVRHLREVPQFRNLLDSRTLTDMRQALADAAASPPTAVVAEDEDIRTALRRIEALLLTMQPVAATSAPERTVRKLQVPGIRPANMGEIGFLGQTPLAVDDGRSAVLYVGSGDGVVHAVDPDAGRVHWSQPLPAGYRMPQAFAVWQDFLLVTPQSDDLLAAGKALLLLDRET